MVKSSGVEESYSRFCAVDMDSILPGVLDLGEQLMLVSKLPMPTEPPIGGTSKFFRSRFGEVAFRVDQRDDPALRG
jgi:hypothetical protein